MSIILDDNSLDKTPFRRILPSIYRRFSKLSDRKYFIKSRYGLRFLLDKSNLIDRSMIFRFGWEGEKYSKFLEYINATLSSDIVFLDVGSHWGLYAIRAVKSDRIAEIHAFEPDKRNLAQLHANLMLNSMLDRITVHPIAASNYVGKVLFLNAIASNRGVSRMAKPEDTGDVVEVSCVPIDQLLEYENRHIAVKIDVEGAEQQVVEGMADLLARNKVVAMIEIDAKCFDVTRDKLEKFGLKYVKEISDKKGERDYLFQNF